MNTNQSVFACNMGALSPVERVRHLANTAQLIKTVRAVQEQDQGYSLRFANKSATILQVAKFVALERLCCPFFDFALEVRAGADSVALEITGPEGIKDFIRSEFGEVIR
jgi:hypothetical protein